MENTISLFEPVPLAIWQNAHVENRAEEDIDDIEQFKDAGVIPAGWIIKQLGLTGACMGELRLQEEDSNRAVSEYPIQSDHIFQLTSYLSQQVRDRLGIQFVLTQEVQKKAQK